MPEAYSLTKESVEKLSRRLFQLERIVQDEVANMRSVRPRHAMPREVYVGLTDGSGISARNGSTLGTGNVTLYKVNPSTGTAATLGTLSTVTCWNISQTAVDASTYVIIEREKFGAYLCIVEDCG